MERLRVFKTTESLASGHIVHKTVTGYSLFINTVECFVHEREVIDNGKVISMWFVRMLSTGLEISCASTHEMAIIMAQGCLVKTGPFLTNIAVIVKKLRIRMPVNNHQH